MKITSKVLALIFGGAVMVSCGGGDTANQNADDPQSFTTPTEEPAVEADPMANKGVGPITSVEIAAEIDPALAAKGEEIFTTKCTACHKIDSRYVGPPLKGVTTKQSPEWIMNMIMAPEKMVAEDPVAKALLAEYLAPMANQSITEEEARAIYEYFRTQN